MKIKLAHVINFMSPAGKEIGIVKLLNKLDPEHFEPTLIVIDKVYDLLNLDTNKTRLIEFNKKKSSFSIIIRWNRKSSSRYIKDIITSDG